MDNSRSTNVFHSFQQKPLAKDHSQLAMRAAKQMRRSKHSQHKVKIGHTVCQHLLLMINEPDCQQPGVRASRRYHDHATEQNTGRLVGVDDLFSAQAIQQSAANDRQFSLAF
tara:strand:- start:1744 stop:2079 length:336 start_codon:yes stop_codon:yes gene_type:complete